MAFTIPNVGIAGFPDQSEPDSVDIDILTAGHSMTGVVSGCAVTAQGSPDMTVAVASGTISVLGVNQAVTSGNVTIGAAHATLPRKDIVVVNSSGTKSVTAGTAASQPLKPAIPANSVVLAEIYVPALDTTINTNQITDKRVIVQAALTTAGLHLVARATLDEGPISSTVFQPDDVLLAPVLANEVWMFEFYTWWVAGSGSAHPKLRWTFPAGAVSAAMQYIGRNTAGNVVDFQVQTATSPLDPGQAMFATNVNAYGFVLGPIRLLFTNGATAGNFALEWAPNAAVNLTRKANSTLWGVKLA